MQRCFGSRWYCHFGVVVTSLLAFTVLQSQLSEGSPACKSPSVRQVQPQGQDAKPRSLSDFVLKAMQGTYEKHELEYMRALLDETSRIESPSEVAWCRFLIKQDSDTADQYEFTAIQQFWVFQGPYDPEEWFVGLMPIFDVDGENAGAQRMARLVSSSGKRTVSHQTVIERKRKADGVIEYFVVDRMSIYEDQQWKVKKWEIDSTSDPISK